LEVLEDRTLPSTFLVDHLADDTVGAGLSGSLRYALTNATANDHITFGVTGTINLTGALPNLAHSISIDGPGPSLMTVRRDTGGSYGIFTVADPATVSISGLTIADGSGGPGISNGGTLAVSNCTVTHNSGGFGGGIDNQGELSLSNSTVSRNRAIDGGGIFNDSDDSMTISHSTISDNVASGVDPFLGLGGGIANQGTMLITSTTISGNRVFDGMGGQGGGIFNGGEYHPATLTISNSTISGNTASGAIVGGGNDGAGIANGYTSLLLGNVTINSSTVWGNTVSGFGYGGGISIWTGVLNLRNTIVAGNTIQSGGGPDLDGNLSSSGYNLIGNTQGGSGFDDTDLLNVNPLLSPLQDNGGPTQTMALLAGSPALNTGDQGQLGVADQRGVVRSGGVNIGAYQASASALVVSGPATATAGTPFDVTVKAVDSFAQTAVGYTGTATFTSADPYGAALPADYTFTLADGGVHTFGAGATLYTAGNWDVTATDTVTASITGAATVTVNPAAADHLLFLQQPTDTAAGQTLSPVIVEIVDQFGNVETGDNSDTITLSLGVNPGGGTLSGTLTLTVVNGVATFSDLAIDLAGSGYTLHATIGGGLPDTESNPFTITT
jgi:hypothetical protein